MRKIIVLAVIILAIGYTLSITVYAGSSEDIKETTEIKLSKRFKRLLSAEMNAIQRGMNSLAIAVPAGQWDDIAGTSKELLAGFIMKKKLSNKQMDEFRGDMPAGYIELDREFKKAAEGLARAAVNHDVEQVNVFFCKIGETCMMCHNTYAKKRFKGFER